MFCNTPVICYFKESDGNFAYCDVCVIAAAVQKARTLHASVSWCWVPSGAVPVTWLLSVGGDGPPGPAGPWEGFADVLWERAV